MPCMLLHKGPRREELYVCAIKLARAQESSGWKHWCKVTIVGLRMEGAEGGMQVQFKSTDTL
jgi:hypothetical protein